MLQLYYSDFLFLTPYIISGIFATFFFFKFNTATIFYKPFNNDFRRIKASPTKKNHNFVCIRALFFMFLLLLTQNLLYRGHIGTFWCFHLCINTFIYSYINVLLFIVLFIITLLYNISVTRIYIATDYLYVISIIFISTPLIFLSNNFFIFYFLIEFLACLIFFKFVVSRFWYKNSINFFKNSATDKYLNLYPKMYINILFFQYWSSFFSSIMLLFFFINLEYIFNSSEWDFINFSINFIKLPISYYLYFFLFIFGFFLKIGITPFHLYKIEVYKGLPILSIFLYTIIFFLIYLIYFIIILLFNFNNFFMYFWLSIILLSVIGGLFVIFLLFDINFFKSFFAYSTIINSLSFLFVLFSIF